MAEAIQDVRDMLREGFGVEDIAIQLEQPVDAVRRLVRRWQDSGEMRAILKPGNEAASTGMHPSTGLTETPSN